MLEPTGQTFLTFCVELAGVHAGFLRNTDNRVVLRLAAVRGFLEHNTSPYPTSLTQTARAFLLIEMNLQLIKLLRLSQRETWDKLQTFKVNSEDIGKSLQIINNYITYVVDRKIKSAQFIKFDRI